MLVRVRMLVLVRVWVWVRAWVRVIGIDRCHFMHRRVPCAVCRSHPCRTYAPHVKHAWARACRRRSCCGGKGARARSSMRTIAWSVEIGWRNAVGVSFSEINKQNKPRIGPRGCTGYLPLVTSLVAFLPFHPATACTLTSRLSHATPCRPSRHGTGRRPSPLPVFNRLGPDFQTFPPLGASCIGRKRASEDNSYLAYCIRRGPPKKTKKRETAWRAL